MAYRGVILAGGKGSRLGELTRVTNKHLLPVGSEPMVYHPLKKLTSAGVSDILLVSGTEHMGDFVELLGSGRQFGCSMTYRVQDEAGGIAQALGLARDFVGASPSVVLLGDNIFEDPLGPILASAAKCPDHAHLMLKEVANPSRFGVAQVEGGRIVDIEEKPATPRSRFAVTGIYVFPPDVFGILETLTPSQRGELEITDVNQRYLRANRLDFGVLPGYWSDAGTLDSLFESNRLVHETPPRF